MTATIMRKTLGVTVLSLAAAFLLGLAPSANASSIADKTPKIFHIASIMEHSVVVPFKLGDLHGKKVVVVVSVKNRETGKITDKKFTLTLNDHGRGSVTVKNLKEGTKYAFKVKIRKSGSDTFSHFSKYQKAKTLTP